MTIKGRLGTFFSFLQPKKNTPKMDNIFLPNKNKCEKKCGRPTGYNCGQPLDWKQKFCLGWPGLPVGSYQRTAPAEYSPNLTQDVRGPPHSHTLQPPNVSPPPIYLDPGERYTPGPGRRRWKWHHQFSIVTGTLASPGQRPGEKRGGGRGPKGAEWFKF